MKYKAYAKINSETNLIISIDQINYDIEENLIEPEDTDEFYYVLVAEYPFFNEFDEPHRKEIHPIDVQVVNAIYFKEYEKIAPPRPEHEFSNYEVFDTELWEWKSPQFENNVPVKIWSGLEKNYIDIR